MSKGYFVEVDLSELHAYTKRSEKATKELPNRLKKFILKMALIAKARTVLLTPVDSGELRDSWDLTDVEIKGNDVRVYLVNPMEYASFVEDGHRQKARWVPGEIRNGKFRYIKGHKKGIKLKTKWIPGYHMVRLSLEELERDIPAHSKKFLDAFVKEFDL